MDKFVDSQISKERDKIIQISKLSVNYDQVEALKHVSFDIYDKEFIGIIGPNGGGKTTLVKTILGLLEPKIGTVKIKENEIIGYVPQLTTFDRSFPITVEEVILTGHLPVKLKILQKFSLHEYEHAVRVMTRLGIESLRKRQIGTLSGGQMQRVLIARALMNHPTILILDEPTAGVDEKAKRDVYTMLQDLNKDMTILIVTHDTGQLLDHLNRVIYINKTAHIHSKGAKTPMVDENGCPIEWFILGEQIQKELLETEGAAND
jgi:zinc transport system ATP-binding protein